MFDNLRHEQLPALRRCHRQCEILLALLRQPGEWQPLPQSQAHRPQLQALRHRAVDQTHSTCDRCNPGLLIGKRCRKSNRPQACAVCGYDAHYEVCHIRPITDFHPPDFVAQVNELSNLVALCPNHHWEFDHGKLPTAAVLKEPVQPLSNNEKAVLKIENGL